MRSYKELDNHERLMVWGGGVVLILAIPTIIFVMSKIFQSL